ncbi:Uncharacterized conserved protein YdhG, YjbR/CyaY-like superfamily, DUF1801 family [Devosia lucknowensis]|uniref:Uncharacterized conserved protein YdhG, YjbR/CyaY-like superfamily, DUF1801 family n=1 Tax=Devosia lucknowensis TaxID=1096929 RepID=A0A1Y6G7K3_9HYPH|nr:DUF1801 domain-containing protein [Devosia lucknowensis]SMQ86141.1 Uncharacterized conserved protein YdhG, YjbR/CyaY-like superfamily, DUF1801 family [Devosia lucknowensis]
MSNFADHDAYIDAAPETLQPLLTHLRARLAHALPGLDEIMRYDMPGFGTGSVVAAGYGAFSKQCGLYVSKGAISTQAEAIAAAGLKASKTGVTFSPARPMPDELIAALAQASRAELGL